MADWARRAGQGAYFDWVVANAILPPEDDRYSDVRKIDRSTVLEIGEIADQFADIQTKLDEVDNGVNPLGLAQDAVLFDLDPALTKRPPARKARPTSSRSTSGRSTASAMTADFFDYANEMKVAQRESQNSQRDFATSYDRPGPGAHERADRDLRLPL